jgi:hypothetical protein
MAIQSQKPLAIALFLMGIGSAALAFKLSLEVRIGIDVWGKGGGVDLAADGGALGFALLAGTCFASCAYLMKPPRIP